MRNVPSRKQWILVLVSLLLAVAPVWSGGGLVLEEDEAPVLRGHRLARWEACEEVAARGGTFLLYAGRSLTPEERDALRSTGTVELKWMGGGVYLVRYAGDGRAACEFDWVRGARPYDWQLKVGSTLQAALERGDEELTLGITFEPDVAEPFQEELLGRYGLRVLRRETPEWVVVRARRELVEHLAGEDGIHLLSAMSLARKVMNLRTSHEIRAFDVRDVPYALWGTGVRIGEWDGSSPWENHEALPRVTAKQRNSADQHNLSHATHVAGTLVAIPPEGQDSNGKDKRNARGMAPGATVLGWDWTDHLSEKRKAYRAKEPIDLDTNSWGTTLGWECCGVNTQHQCVDWIYYGYEWLFGRYGKTAESLDELVVDVGAISFWSVSNDASDWGQDPHCHSESNCPGNCHYQQCSHSYRDGHDGWLTVSPESSAKNVISVGAVNRAFTVTSFSSRGPAKDGRIKPDVVAPGVNVYSTLPGDDYGVKSGTSMATPAVAGSTALLLEEMKGYSLPVRPELVKALLIHTARDRVRDDIGDFYSDTSGPDYKYGWGLVDIRAAVNVVRTHLYRDPMWELGTLEREGQVAEYTIQHEGGPFRATLVWTDPPGVPDDDTQRDLTIDLDLELVDPRGRVLYRSWYMPYQKTGKDEDLAKPAERCTSLDCSGKRNDRDNVEVADITADEGIAGTWRLRVVARHLPQGRANYALVLPRPILQPDPTEPEKGATWSLGETRTIRWNSGDGEGNVKIDIRCGFDDWHTLVEETENDGAWDWHVEKHICLSSEIRVVRLNEGVEGLSERFVVEPSDSTLEPEDPASDPNPSVEHGDVTFRVRFRDPDGLPPTWVHLHLWGPNGEDRSEEMHVVAGDEDVRLGALYEVRIADLAIGTWRYRFEADQYGLRFETDELQQVVDEQVAGECGEGILLTVDPSSVKVHETAEVMVTLEDAQGRRLPDHRVEFVSDHEGIWYDPQKPLPPDEPGDHNRMAYTRNADDVPGHPELVGTATIKYYPKEPGTHRLTVLVDGGGHCDTTLDVYVQPMVFKWRFEERSRNDREQRLKVYVWVRKEDGSPLRNAKGEFSGFIRPANGGPDVPLEFDPPTDRPTENGRFDSSFRATVRGIAHVKLKMRDFDASATELVAVTPGAVDEVKAHRIVDGAERGPDTVDIDWADRRGSTLWGIEGEQYAWRADLASTVEGTVGARAKWWDALDARARVDGVELAVCGSEDAAILRGDTLEERKFRRDLLPGSCWDVDWLDDDHVLFGMYDDDAQGRDAVWACDRNLANCRGVGYLQREGEKVVDIEVRPDSERYLVLSQYEDPPDSYNWRSDVYIMRRDHSFVGRVQEVGGEHDCGSLAWAPDGSAFAVACHDEILVFDYPSLRASHFPMEGAEDGNLAVGRDPDGHLWVYVASNNEFRVFDQDGYVTGQDEIHWFIADGDTVQWNEEHGLLAVVESERNTNHDVRIYNFSGDEEAPEIRFGSYPGSVGRDMTSVEIPVEIEDAHWIVRVHRSVNGGAEELVEVPREQTRMEFTTEVPLEYGRNVLRICAYDLAGNGSGIGADNPRNCRDAVVWRQDEPPWIREVKVEPGRVSPWEPVVIRAEVGDAETGVADGGVVAHVQRPDEEDVVTVVLHDDGVDPDETAGDGVYAGRLETSSCGEGVFVVDVTAEDTRRNRNEAENAARFEVRDDPVIEEVWHEPAEPTSADTVTFHARVHDTSGLAAVELVYRHGGWARERRVAMERQGETDEYVYRDPDLWRGPVEYRVEVRDPGGYVASREGEPFELSCAESEQGDLDGDGWRGCDECDDGSSARHPGAEEVPGNGVDDDCDGLVDESSLTLAMRRGWQLVGLAVDDRMSASGMCELASATGGSVETVLRWENRWRSYRCAVGLGDFEFAGGRGYFVKVGEEFSWPQQGEEYPDPHPVELGEGWTLVSLPTWASGKTAREVCEELEANGCLPLKVLHWKNRWRSYDCRVGLGDFELGEGEGFFVRAGTRCTWHVRRDE